MSTMTTKLRALGGLRTCSESPEETLKRGAAKRREALDRLITVDGVAMCHGNERVLDLDDVAAKVWARGGVL